MGGHKYIHCKFTQYNRPLTCLINNLKALASYCCVEKIYMATSIKLNHSKETFHFPFVLAFEVFRLISPVSQS